MAKKQAAASVLNVSEAARVLGVAAKTVRVWTEAGKLPCQRTNLGYRIYDAKTVAALKKARETA
jgi:excisionase family DNA binding protein